MKKTKVIILGGGFAGLSAAMYLDKTWLAVADAEVTLINREKLHFVHANAARSRRGRSLSRRHCQSDPSHPSSCEFVQAEVQAIDLSARRVVAWVE